MDRKLTVVLAADVVGYSKLMERDEAGTFARLKAGRQELFDPEIARHHGRVFKVMGDGMLAEFTSVVDAVECAVTLQRGLAERNAAFGENERIQVRIGINLGEIIVEGEDRYGEGVNIAARLEQLAEPGGIVISAAVAKEVEKRLAFKFEPLGLQKVKNIAEPVQAFKVKLDAMPTKRRAGAGPKRWSVGVVGALIIVLAVVGGAWIYAEQTRSDSVQTSSESVPSVAVLPFDNLSDDPKLSYFSDGVSEDIISMLARSPDLTVVARNSSFVYKGKATDVRLIGKELNVRYVLEGSVRKEADRVRIVAQLIDASSGEHVWAERFDKSGGDPWALQDEVTGKVIAALVGEKGQLKRAQYREAWGKDTAQLQEYDFYLRGHDLLMQFSPETNKEAGRIWREGLEKFPNSALLRIKLGWYHSTQVTMGWSTTIPDDIREAGRLVREAFSIHGLTPMERRLGHWLYASVLALEGDYSGAMEQVDAVIAMAPNDAFLIGDCAQFLIAVGDYDKAIEWADFAVKNDPAMKDYYFFMKGWALTADERYAESQEVLKGVSNILIMIPLFRAINAVRLGAPDKARQEAQKALQMIPDFTAERWRSFTFASDPSILDRQVADLRAAGIPTAVQKISIDK